MFQETLLCTILVICICIFYFERKEQEKKKKTQIKRPRQNLFQAKLPHGSLLAVIIPVGPAATGFVTR